MEYCLAIVSCILIIMKYFLSTIILIALASTSQYFFDTENKDFKASAEYQPLVANTTTYDKFNFGLKTALADYFWLSAIQYYGGWRDDHNYSKLSDYISLTTELDSKFSYPYAFAALVLPAEKIDQGYAIAEKGLDENLNDWQIPYFLATSNHIYRKDKSAAAKYFDLAAKTPGAPDSLKFISAAYNSSPDNRQTAKAIWQAIYDNSNDSSAKETADNYLTHYEIMDFYDQASTLYQQKIGAWPKTPDDLITGGILTKTAADPFGFSFEFDENGKIRLKNN
jgi:hypothetical protein